MTTYANKEQQTTSAARANGATASIASHFADQRPQAALQRKWQTAADHSPRVQQLKGWQSLADQTLQRKGKLEEEELVQGKFEALQRKPNNTGLPDNLKSGIEDLSGLAMDDVQVHYNSAKPSQLQAHAYAQGTDIHVAPGQEKHLSHEAWHVVQQKQGRVQPTLKLNGQSINDDMGLEREADVMGNKANG